MLGIQVPVSLSPALPHLGDMRTPMARKQCRRLQLQSTRGATQTPWQKGFFDWSERAKWTRQKQSKSCTLSGVGSRRGGASRGQNRRKHKRARRDSQGGRNKGCHQSMAQDGEEADSGEPTEERRSSRRRNLLRENLVDRQDSGSAEMCDYH